MSEPRLPNELKLGRFRLDDVLRALGGYQWLLCSIMSSGKPSAPLLAEIMAHLYVAGLAVPKGVLNGKLYYDSPVLFSRENLRAPLNAGQVEELLTRVCEKASEMNRSDAPFFVRAIHLFGSCLRGAAAPRDLDLAVEVLQDGTLMSEPSYAPLAPPSSFDIAVRPLALRKPGLIKLHHIGEVAAIGAPRRLIWEASHGRVFDSPMVTPNASSAQAQDYPAKLQNQDRRQQEFDALARHIGSIQTWPQMPVLALPQKQSVSVERYQSWLEQPCLLTRAHLHCLPPGPLRDRILQMIEGDIKRNPAVERAWTEAGPTVEDFIQASIQYSPWVQRYDGRLLASRRKFPKA